MLRQQRPGFSARYLRLGGLEGARNDCAPPTPGSSLLACARGAIHHNLQRCNTRKNSVPQHSTTTRLRRVAGDGQFWRAAGGASDGEARAQLSERDVFGQPGAVRLREFCARPVRRGDKGSPRSGPRKLCPSPATRCSLLKNPDPDPDHHGRPNNSTTPIPRGPFPHHHLHLLLPTITQHGQCHRRTGLEWRDSIQETNGIL